jgi:hypothetical protein
MGSDYDAFSYAEEVERLREAFRHLERRVRQLEARMYARGSSSEEAARRAEPMQARVEPSRSTMFRLGEP